MNNWSFNCNTFLSYEVVFVIQLFQCYYSKRLFLSFNCLLLFFNKTAGKPGYTIACKLTCDLIAPTSTIICSLLLLHLETSEGTVDDVNSWSRLQDARNLITEICQQTSAWFNLKTTCCRADINNARGVWAGGIAYNSRVDTARLHFIYQYLGYKQYTQR